MVIRSESKESDASGGAFECVRRITCSGVRALCVLCLYGTICKVGVAQPKRMLKSRLLLASHRAGKGSEASTHCLANTPLCVFPFMCVALYFSQLEVAYAILLVERFTKQPRSTIQGLVCFHLLCINVQGQNGGTTSLFMK